MFDDDSIFNLFNNDNSTMTQTESQTDTSLGQDTGYSSQTSYNPYSNVSQGEYDDYSVNPNYTSEQSYNSVSPTMETEQNETTQRYFTSMEAPLIKKNEAPVVSLVKSRQKIELKGRMKIVLSMFVIIVASLIFVTFYNFISANKIRNSFADKQQEITALEASISKLKAEYNYLDSDEEIKKLAEREGYVDVTDENTITVSLGEEHYEAKIEDLPSNWFNDVCEFFSKLFG